jgi:hypothetical protein
MKDLRHRCDVMEPPRPTDENGHAVGSPTTILANVPCSIEQLSGREGDVAHQTRGFAVTRVKFYGDPRKPIKSHYYLQVGERKLEIADVNDVQQNGREYELLCGEMK